MAGYVIAVLLCLGDNCDLVHVEPGIDYPTYDACAAAAAKSATKIGELTGRLQAEEGRQGDIVCLHDRLTIVEVEEEYEAVAPVIVRERPEAAARPVGTLERGRKARVTGAVAGTRWFRVALPNGHSGFVYGDRLRKVAVGGGRAAPESAGAAEASSQPAAATPLPSPSAQAVPPAPEQQAAVVPPPRSPAAGPAARPLQEFRDCDVCPAMVALPGGDFQMGSNADSSERPHHRVGISAFAIGKFEVTQGEWNACVAAGGCTYKPRAPAGDDNRLPMTNLSWDDATQYARWLKQLTGKPYRLPSEAEWEYAARAGTATPYPWGSQVGVAMANCNGCGGAYHPRQPEAVGSFPPNPWGLHGMLGGVAEWVEDCWHKSYNGAPTGGGPWEGPNCGQRVLRGGSWKNPPKDLTVSARNFYDASVRYAANGLRVALGSDRGR